MARILIVEDETRIASFVSKGLAAEGHSTTVAADGVAGLDLALSGEFDLMILDIGLPRLDGYGVLDGLRTQGSAMPVIVLTARDSVTDTVGAFEGGADDYMPSLSASPNCWLASGSGCGSRSLARPSRHARTS
jgi:DNA-binding response OmpR family regulator